MPDSPPRPKPIEDVNAPGDTAALPAPDPLMVPARV